MSDGVDVHLQSALWHIKQAGGLVPEDWRRKFLEGLEYAIGGVLLVVPVVEEPVVIPPRRTRRQAEPEDATAQASDIRLERSPYMDYCESTGSPVRDCECDEHGGPGMVNWGGREDPPVDGEGGGQNVMPIMPPPAYSPGTCKTCGMMDCHDGVFHDIDCSYCGALAGEPCVSASGFKSSKAHQDRRKTAWRKHEDVERKNRVERGLECASCGMLSPCRCDVSCERCGAKVGEACVSAAGNVAQWRHAVRRDAPGAASASG